MPARPEAPASQVYRYTLLIRLPVLAASAFWTAAAVLLVLGGEDRPHIYAGVAFFILFFLGSSALYWRTAIRTDAAGIEYRGPLRRIRAPWAQVRQVNVYSGVFREYQVTTDQGGFSFTGLLARHRALIAEIALQARRVR